MGHTAKCEQRTAEDLAKANAWDATWPGACKKCLGQGGFASYGDRWTPPDFDLCICMEEGRCPRCGAETMSEEVCEEEKPCSACGWNWMRGEGDARPEVDYWCACLEEQVDTDVEGLADPFWKEVAKNA